MSSGRTKQVHLYLTEREFVAFAIEAQKRDISMNGLFRAAGFQLYGIEPEAQQRAVQGVAGSEDADAIDATITIARLRREYHAALQRANTADRQLTALDLEVDMRLGEYENVCAIEDAQLRAGSGDELAEVPSWIRNNERAALEKKIAKGRPRLVAALREAQDATNEIARQLAAQHGIVMPGYRAAAPVAPTPAVLPPAWALARPWDETEPKSALHAPPPAPAPAPAPEPGDETIWRGIGKGAQRVLDRMAYDAIRSAPPEPELPAPVRPARECPICHGSKVLPGTASMPCALCDPAGATAAMAGVEPRDP